MWIYIYIAYLYSIFIQHIYIYISYIANVTYHRVIILHVTDNSVGQRNRKQVLRNCECSSVVQCVVVQWIVFLRASVWLSEQRPSSSFHLLSNLNSLVTATLILLLQCICCTCILFIIDFILNFKCKCIPINILLSEKITI